MGSAAHDGAHHIRPNGPGRHPTNARVPRAELVGPLGRAVGRVLAPLDAALDTGGLTDRGGVQVLRLAFTLADLDGRPLPDAGHITEALNLHQVDNHARYH
ncbi:hypothetical protein ACLQ2S_26305 [Micromonospora sp. DT48]|uniref:magnesium chelatase subunit ChlI family protein n=1 Tax=Micromonospora sp. DT48 TaxID=3393429 RepID=UPI003CF1650B